MKSLNISVNKRYSGYIASVDSINFSNCTLEDLNPAVAIGCTAKEALDNLIAKVSKLNKYNYVEVA